MSDGYLTAFGPEADHWPGFALAVQQAREKWEHAAWYEERVQRRLDSVKAAGTVTQEARGLAYAAASSRPPPLTHAGVQGIIPLACATSHHRVRLGESGLPPLLIHRPVSRREYQGHPEAMKAYWKEWKNLEARGTWDWSTLCD